MTDLPPGWERVTLGSVCGVASGATPKTSEPENWGGEIPWITPDDLSRDRSQVVNAGRRFLTPEGFESCSAEMVPAGSVIFSSRAPIGYVAIAGQDLCSNQGCKIAVPSRDIDSRYLYWHLVFSTPDISSRASGTTFKEISAKGFAETVLHLPPLAEQLRIVDALEDHLSLLDSAIDGISSVERRLPILESSILQSAFDRFEGTADIDHQADHSVRSNTKFDYSTLRSLPVGWRWRLAEDVCSAIDSGSTPPPNEMHASVGDIPFLKVYNIAKSGTLDFSIKPTFVASGMHRGRLARSRALPGDVLTNIVGPPLGKTAIVPDTHPEWNINQAIVRFRAGENLLPEWLWIVLRAPSVVRRLSGTAKATAGQFNIALSTCRKLPIPVPPVVEQQSIVEHVRRGLEETSRQRHLMTIERLRAEHLRASLLRTAFTGRLVDQDPSDESASVLLERIRSERAAQPPKQRGRRTRASAIQETLL